MKLSIVIVNYNVKYFLKQCIESVNKAIQHVDSEVFVVDNNSTDGSVEMVKTLFPNVILIDNKDNVGFSKANNQAIRQSKGEYVLLLNPDTIVAEDTFEKVVNFMDEHPNAGGLGVKMVDGNGNFLPESKRGLPTPDVAFYKIFGLSSVFPKSKTFSKYHLGFLPDDEINKIDVLSGAFMFLRKETLDKVGLLDETFFMYGEDIDLSYRITLGGYDNYYFPDSSIIHYKGESTKKSSVNYVFIFYKAMAIFAEKHFGKNKASLFSALIKIAIFFRAGLALFNRLIETSLLPIFDFIVLFSSLHVVKRIYQDHMQAYNDVLTTNLSILGLALIMFLALLFSGAYDRPVKHIHLIKGIIIATPLIILSYLLVYKKLTISMGAGIIAILGAGVTIILVRYLLHILKISSLKFEQNKKYTLVIGSEDEIEKSSVLISLTQPNTNILSLVINESIKNVNEAITLTLKNNKSIDEVVFCSQEVSYKQMISSMSQYADQSIDFKIAYPESKFVIGSSNLNTSGELYLLKLKGITSKRNKRAKRTFDLSLSLALIISFPLTCWFFKNKLTYLKNLFAILRGRLSFVGFSKNKNNMLPYIKKGVLSMYEWVKRTNQKPIDSEKINRIYSNDYSVVLDIKTVKNNFLSLDKKDI